MDASEQNEVFNLGKISLPEDHAVAAIEWIHVTKNINESRLIVLRLILSLIIDRLTKYNVWLIVGNSSWQPDTRVVRHRGLWNMLKARGVEVTHFSDTFEHALEGDQGLKYFGAKLITELSAESVVKTIAEERCAYILALPQDVIIGRALKKGWQADGGFDEGLLKFVVENNGLILKAVGEFDDAEAGFIGVAEPRLIKGMLGAE